MKFLYPSGSRPLDGYTIKRGIGRGGFGEVYFATSDAGKEVALKHVERNLEVELRGVGQCLNLKHVNLIDLHDIRYDEQGEAWVVMEYVAGSSLKDVIDRNPNGLPHDEVVTWFRGLADGVIYLHDHGIVHRDLKPGNVFEDEGIVKIGDYGLSKYISCSRRSGQTESVGTFHYMAPEIGKGIYGKEIDIYALGIILYEMLIGRVPFEGESSQEIIMKHLTADPDLAGVPQRYRAVIARAMQKDPEKRFRDVSEMLGTFLQPDKAVEVKSKFEFQVDPAPAVATVVPSRKVPPVRMAMAPTPVEPLYIGDDDREIQFGPLQLATSAAQDAGQGAVVSPGIARRAEEPIAKACGAACGRLANWWNYSPLGTPLKVILILIALVIVIANAEILLPAAIAGSAFYVVYLGIRTLAVAAGDSRIVEARVREQAHAAQQPPPQYRSPGWQTLSWEKQGRAALRMKTLGDRVGELSGSMLAAAAISTVLTVVMMVIGQSEWLNNSPAQMAGPAWLWLTTTLGAWLILAAGKFWEPHGDKNSVDQVKRRCVLLVLGLVFGAVAFATHQFLMVDSLHDGLVIRGISTGIYSTAMYAADGAPRLPAYLAYFGAIFATIGWWKQTDPMRSSRMRIGPIIVTLIAAWVWQLVWPFPQPWGFLLVASLSIAAQLSAPWLNPAQRAAIRDHNRTQYS
jgi:hypothetical protein